jgi:transposase
MKRSYEFRLYPRKRERAALERLLEQHREVYNRALEQCKNVYEVMGKGQSALSQWDYFRDWRNAFPDLILNASSLQHTLRRLDKAFSAFFRRVKAGETPGYPRFVRRRKLSERRNSKRVESRELSQWLLSHCPRIKGSLTPATSAVSNEPDGMQAM